MMTQTKRWTSLITKFSSLADSHTTFQTQGPRMRRKGNHPKKRGNGKAKDKQNKETTTKQNYLIGYESSNKFCGTLHPRPTM